jgi:hypothetical protein
MSSKHAALAALRAVLAAHAALAALHAAAVLKFLWL